MPRGSPPSSGSRCGSTGRSPGGCSACKRSRDLHPRRPSPARPRRRRAAGCARTSPGRRPPSSSDGGGVRRPGGKGRVCGQPRSPCLLSATRTETSGTGRCSITGLFHGSSAATKKEILRRRSRGHPGPDPLARHSRGRRDPAAARRLFTASWSQALLCLARRRADVLFAMLRNGTLNGPSPTLRTGYRARNRDDRRAGLYIGRTWSISRLAEGAAQPCGPAPCRSVSMTRVASMSGSWSAGSSSVPGLSRASLGRA